MPDIWSGDIILSDSTTVQDIILTTAQTTTPTTLHLPPNLRFLSFVSPARIPLHLAAGPSLDVSTTTRETQTWFSQHLLHSSFLQTEDPENTPEWWTQPWSQSPIGILASTDTADAGYTPQNPVRITELLFYGIIHLVPSSNTPALDEELIPTLHVNALPLSSDLLYTAYTLSPPLQSPNHPTFLPNPPSSTSTKRKHDAIFDTATQLQRTAKRKGGASVAAAAARATESRALAHRRSISISSDARKHGLSERRDTRPRSAGGSSMGGRLERERARSVSVGVSASEKSVHHGFGTQKRGKGGLGSTGLSHVTTTTPTSPSTTSTQAEKEKKKQTTTAEPAPETETRNKEALSRVVLAAMRMHGFTQRNNNKKAAKSQYMSQGRRDSTIIDTHPEVTTPTTNTAPIPDTTISDDEFKLLYHQTYRSAICALRKIIAKEPLYLRPDGALRDVVEKLLDIFCTEWGSVDGVGVSETAGVRKGGPGAGYFDLPSGKRAVGREEGVVKGSPVARRKGVDSGGEVMGC
ncbi:hypothetical protein M011DRAFT_490222 [Sporormia fimetaria CBS 119925]|uniref:Sld7 C-terminal domain-containing protein n=1 Tax=Sporormia fimetaria CBS 119925 TaxID=1340428 RepID=A0A6A6UZ06_9PLEO|nr:hypothetical protein M011DRAFT_490222 [Sporormia fimetaria CBS 119925]